MLVDVLVGHHTIVTTRNLYFTLHRVKPFLLFGILVSRRQRQADPSNFDSTETQPTCISAKHRSLTILKRICFGPKDEFFGKIKNCIYRLTIKNKVFLLTSQGRLSFRNRSATLPDILYLIFPSNL